MSNRPLLFSMFLVVMIAPKLLEAQICNAGADELPCLPLDNDFPYACDFFTFDDNFSSGNNLNESLYESMAGGCSIPIPGKTYNGNERLFEINVPLASYLQVSLSDLSADLDVFVFLCAGNGQVCLSNPNLFNSGTNPEFQLLEVPEGRYIIVVDGANAGELSSFSLNVTTTPAPANLVCDINIDVPVDIQCGDVFEDNPFPYSLFDYNLYDDCDPSINQTTMPYDANDKIYTIDVDGPTTLTLKLTNLATDVDLFVFKCIDDEEYVCLNDLSDLNTGAEDETVVIPNADGFYQIIVDGFNAAQTAFFTLEADCGPCGPVQPITCGDILQNETNEDQGNDFESIQYGDCYAGGDTYAAPDVVYELYVPERSNVKATLELLDNIDLDLFLSSDCSMPDSCFAASTTANVALGIYNETLDVVLDSGTYYLIVDGKLANQVGSFNLSIECLCTCIEPEDDLPAGSTLLCDNFETHTTGNISAQSTRWQPWSSAVLSPQVVSDGEDLALALAPSAGQDVEAIYLLEDQWANRFRLSWRMFIGAGRTGRYAVLHQAPDDLGAGSNTAYSVQFNGSGQGAIALPTGSNFIFSYPEDQWFDVIQIIDQDLDQVEWWIGNEFIASWAFSLGSSGSDTGLAALHFYTQLAEDSYLVDDICVWIPQCEEMMESGPEVCLLNGTRNGSELARCQGLYNSVQWEACLTVCDFGGPFIFRGDTFTDSISLFDLAPSAIFQEPCVMEAYDGILNNSAFYDAGNLYADIYVFTNDQLQDITIDLANNDYVTRAFLFQCDCVDAAELGISSLFSECEQICLQPVDPPQGCSTTITSEDCLFLGNQIVDQSQGDTPNCLVANPSGIGPFTYLWSTGSTNDNIPLPVVNGNYCVTVTDSEGCISSDCYTVNSNCSVNIDFNGQTSDLIAEVLTGLPPFEYLWSTGQTTAVVPFCNACSVIVTDATDCVAVDTFFNIDAPPPLQNDSPIRSATNAQVIEDLPAGTYFILVTSVQEDDYTLSLLPNASCENNPVEIALGSTVSADLNGQGNDFSIGGNGDFVSCYNGDRAYNEEDVVYRFTLPERTATTISLDASSGAMGLFLYNHLCGNNCIKVVETPDDGGNASIEATLDPGIYYLLVDQDAGASSAYTLNFAGVPTPSINLSTYAFEDDPPSGDCPVNAASIHSVVVQNDAHDFSTDHFLTFLTSNPNTQTIRFVDDIGEFYNGLAFTFDVPADDTGDAYKCSYLPGDLLQMYMIDQSGISDYSGILELEFGAGSSPLFTPGSNSTVTSLDYVQVNSANLSYNSTEVSSNGGIFSVEIVTNQPWQVFELTDVEWVHDINPIQGVGYRTVSFAVDANSEFLPRKDTLLFKVSPPQQSGIPLFLFLEIEQKGACGVPQFELVADQNPICAGETVTITPNIDSSFYDLFLFEWDGDASTFGITVSPDEDASYSLTLVNKNCFVRRMADLDITVNEVPNKPTSNGDVTVCEGEVGTISVQAVPNATIEWYDAALDGNLVAEGASYSPPGPGVYFAQANNGDCRSEERTPVSLTIASDPVAMATSIDPALCLGNSTMLNAAASGGDGNYTFSWDNGIGEMTNPAISPNVTTTYTLTVTDGNECQGTDEVTITVNENPEIVVEAIQESSCDGMDGSITVSGTGGQPDYDYVWSTDVTGPVLSNIPAGTYRVTITDANGCQSDASIVLNTTTGPMVLLEGGTVCAGTSFELMPEVSGGAGPYNYLWEDDSNGESLVVNPTANMTFSLTVTDANNCEAVTEAMVDIYEDTQFEITSQDAICGEDNGSAAITILSGTDPLTFQWSTNETNVAIENLASGTYYLSITDGNECQVVDSIAIEASDAPVLHLNGLTLCAGESVVLNPMPTGGNAPYTYLWSTTATTETIEVSPTENTSYQLTLTDDLGCVVEATALVMVNALPVIQEVNIASATCGMENGTIAVIPQGQGALTFMWDNGDNTATINGLAPGNYTLTLTNENECKLENTYSVEAIAPPVLSLPDASVCFGESLTITPVVMNGSEPYQYLWSDGSDGENLPITPGNPTLVALTLTDNDGCIVMASTTIGVNALPELELSSTSATCGIANGSAAVEITNPQAPPYTFEWSNGSDQAINTNLLPGDYTVSVTDGKECMSVGVVNVEAEGAPAVFVASTSICPGSSTDLTAIVTGGTPPFDYLWSDNQSVATIFVSPEEDMIFSVTITDANDCQTFGSAMVTLFESPSLSLDAQNPACGMQNGSISALPSGGAGGYTFNWNNGAENNSLLDLGPGVYSVTLMDANLCSVVQSIELTDIAGPELSVEPVEACLGTMAQLQAQVTQGTAPYNYFWENGGTNDIVNILVNAPTSSLLLTVTDANGCEAVANAQITGFTLPELTLTSIAQEICFGASTELAAAISAGLPPYDLQWSHTANDGLVQTVTPGETTAYTLLVSDSNACETQETISIQVNDLPTAATNADTVICTGQSTQLMATATGGSGQYVYSWSGGLGNISNPVVSPIANTTYSVTVTDSNNCSDTDQVMVGVLPSPTLNFQTESASCGGADGSALAVPMGGTGPYTYLWENGAVTPEIEGLPAGIYTLTLTDNQGCTTVGDVTITSTEGPLVFTSPVTTICAGTAESISAGASGGTPNYTFTWDNGFIGAVQEVNPLESTLYSVTATDANGCSGSAQVFIEVIQPIDASANADPVICLGETTQLMGMASGDIAQISWSASVAGGTFIPNDATLNAFYTPPTAYTGIITLLLRVVGEGDICPSVLAPVNITVAPLPTIIPTDIFCSADFQTYQINLSTSADELSANNGTTIEVGSGVFSIQGIPSDENVLVTAFDTETACDFSIQINSPVCECPPISPPTGTSDVDYCEGEDVPELSVMLEADETANWYDVPTGGMPLASDTTIFTPPGPGVYYVERINLLSFCSSEERTAITVSIHELPANELSSLGSPAICAGDTITLMPSHLNANYTYAWSTGETSPDISVSPDVTTTYVLTVTLDLCAKADSVQVHVVPAIEGAISIDNALECFGDTDGILSIAPLGGQPPFDYQWNTGATESFIFNASAGDYAVTVGDMADCEGVFSISLEQPNDLTLLNSNIQPDTNNTSSGQIMVEIGGGILPYTYSWAGPGNFTSDQATIVNLVSGTYTLTVTDQNDCSFTESFVVPITVSLNELTSWGDNIRLYPNPTKNEVMLECHFQEKTDIYVQVLDVLGQVLFTQKIAQWQHGVQALSLKAYPSGVYWIRVNSESHQWASKIIKE
ncbi:MAG TPA: T9SS type A sorting domain-containing protein [Saprospiraceae bacterium]|nr:T9SS type A sorting domain-containing protein [Saprospiraceae bacterium]HMQ81347.1 T9SS type A sorting domain-containing protein [Saprospiraceae bacterium]